MAWIDMPGGRGGDCTGGGWALPLVPSFRLKSATSHFGRPRASSGNDTPYESEITTAPLKLKSPLTRSPSWLPDRHALRSWR